jgi:hypothetical protein
MDKRFHKSILSFHICSHVDNFLLNIFKDISGAITGRVVGYRLLGHSTLRYPFAIFTGAVKLNSLK